MKLTITAGASFDGTLKVDQGEGRDDAVTLIRLGPGEAFERELEPGRKFWLTGVDDIPQAPAGEPEPDTSVMASDPSHDNGEMPK